MFPKIALVLAFIVKIRVAHSPSIDTSDGLANEIGRLTTNDDDESLSFVRVDRIGIARREFFFLPPFRSTNRRID